MKYAVQFAPEAQDQLDAIEEYVALASGFPTTAARFVDAIIDYCESFETFPERGTRRDDLLLGLRIIGFRKTVNIAFRVDSYRHAVSIVGVFYGGQDYEAAFDEQSNERPTLTRTPRAAGPGAATCLEEREERRKNRSRFTSPQAVSEPDPVPAATSSPRVRIFA